MSKTLSHLSAALADRYRIERELGAGGMATVYLAEDLKHDRKVALKVLKPELAAVLGAERFVVEIKTTAALQHPHILPLFDSGTADGFLYYVMPFIQGETLRGKLDRETQLGVDEAVKLTTAVADALDYAHRHGVIHRDIKPENILLHDGRPMVADFGIALAVSAAAGGRMTETGLSLGTPHYMSPEQATAEKDISARSDVYSLGTVLYEMLAGQPPHIGGSAQQIIMKIITEPATPVMQLRKSVPPNVAAAVARALEKLPADRFETARSFAEALSNPHFAGDHTTVVSAASRPGTPWQRRAVMLGVSTVVATAAALWGWSRSVPPALPHHPSRLVLEAPELGGSTEVAHIALTPDGSALVYGAVVDGKAATWLRPLYAAAAIAIPGTPRLEAYQISADGRELAGFPETGQLVRYPLRGGSGGALPSVFRTGEIHGAISGAYGADSGDGTFWISTADSVLRISLADGSVSRAVATQHDSLLIQQVLPGNRLAVAIYPAAVNRMSAVAGPAFLIDLETGGTTMLVDARVTEIRYASRYLVYVLDNGAMEARPFNPARGATPGDPTTIASDVSLDNNTARFAVASNGTVAYIPEAPRSLVLVDRSGARQSLQAKPRAYGRATFSPDGARIALDFVTADGGDIWVLSLSDSTLSRATVDRFGTSPNWSPDGRSVIYGSLRSTQGGGVIFRVPLGQPEAAESLFASPKLRSCCLSLPDQSALVVAAEGLLSGSGSDIGIIRNAGRGTLEPAVATTFDERTPALTRDGKWLAYKSNQSGQDEIYMQSLDGTSGRLQVSTAGGTEPVWGPDGRELFYRGGVGKGGAEQLMVATVETRPQLRVTSPRRALFAVGDIVAGEDETYYDVSPDGRRFVMVQRNRATQVVVIQNLPALVRQLEGAGRKVP